MGKNVDYERIKIEVYERLSEDTKLNRHSFFNKENLKVRFSECIKMNELRAC